MYTHRSISDLRNKLSCGEVTCTEIVSSYLKQIENKKHLNAFIEVYAAEALEKAKSLDQKLKTPNSWGKLFGTVIGIKDVLCYKDHHVGAASKVLENYTAIYNATAIQKILDEDAIIIGNLNCDEFAMGSSNEHSSHGRVLNAWDETRVPGGSSGGSAVAVQANMCMVSLGSDTGGSVRQPADFCGIIGLKPSYGRVSRYGLLAYASSFDQIGIFAHGVEDAALVLEVIAGADEYDSTCSSSPVPNYISPLNQKAKFKIAYFPECLEHPSLDQEIKTNIEQRIRELRSQGHTVEAVGFDYLDFIVPAYYILTTAEASSNLSRYDGVRFGYRTDAPVDNLQDLYKKTRSAGFGKEVKRRIMLGTFVLSTGYYDAYYAKAQQVRRLIADQTKEIFKSYDLLLMPTTPSTAFKFGEKSNDAVEMFLGDLYTVYANLAGIAAISLPMFKHSNGMPFGLQILADKMNESTLLQFSNQAMHQMKHVE
ncbi:MAG: Asp-tRNA(Asn)/Glu-tRNA(Gln) amidotransferase subunit GatA [Bacteroidota bacterium]